MVFERGAPAVIGLDGNTDPHEQAARPSSGKELATQDLKIVRVVGGTVEITWMITYPL